MYNTKRKLADTIGKRGRRSQILVNLALSACSLVLSLVAVEIGLRLVVPLYPQNPAEFRIPHPVLGWTLEPDASYQYQMREDTVSVAYNSQGFHDLEHQIDNPSGVFRILVLGDSFMEAYSVDMEDAFHRRLEELARSTGHNVEVINMGVGGYGTLQEYLSFRDVGQLYTPGIVLLGFFNLNDLIDNSLELSLMLKPDGITTISRPYLDPKDLTGWNVIPPDFDAAQRVYTTQRALLDAQRHSPTARLVLLRLIRDEIRSLRNRKSLDDASTAHSAEKERRESAQLGMNYCVEPAEYTRAWGITERILAELNEEVERKGAKLIVISIPALDEVSIDYMKQERSNLAYPDKLCVEKAPGNLRLSHILEKLDIGYIDLLPDFRKVEREDGVVLFRLIDLHWNSDGHALAAEVVASELIKRGLLPSAETMTLPLR